MNREVRNTEKEQETEVEKGNTEKRIRIGITSGASNIRIGQEAEKRELVKHSLREQYT